MKKKLLAGIALASVSLLAACANNTSTATTEASTQAAEQTSAVSEETTTAEVESKGTIKVGSGVTPHAEILAEIKDDLAKAGWELEIVEYNDYVIPNTALEAGELDANYFQHLPYLENFNAENGTHLVGAIGVHFEPMAIYAGKTASLAEVKDGATIAVPNDTTNEARALLLLEAQGLIKLKEGAGITATILDIEENPHNLQIKELEAAQVPMAIGDVDFAVINGNYALGAGLSDYLALESTDSLAAELYANYIVVREGDENSDKTNALKEAILTEEIKEFINGKYNGAVLPVF